MSKKLVIGVAVGLAAAVCVVAAKKSRGEAQRTGSGKWQRCMEKMPEDFPPRVMFDTVMAIREDTTRILEKLDGSSE